MEVAVAVVGVIAFIAIYFVVMYYKSLLEEEKELRELLEEERNDYAKVEERKTRYIQELERTLVQTASSHDIGDVLNRLFTATEESKSSDEVHDEGSPEETEDNLDDVPITD